MKRWLTFLLPLCSLPLFAQVHCDGIRYIDPVFPDVDSTIGVVYGENTTIAGNTKTLAMDVYYPASEFFFERPLIVVAHGGSFVAGTRKYIRPLCLALAHRGYVAATIDYRLFDAFAIPIDSVVIFDVAIRASMDMKAAVRWFRENAASNNDFGIDSNYIYAGGVSAGAITALHLAYLDTNDYAAGTYIDSIIEANGGIRGNSSDNHEHSDEVRGILNYSGALKDARWIDPGEPIVFSVHDDQDPIVPYGKGISSEIGTPIELWGSLEVHTEARDDDIRSQLITIENSDGHVSYFLDTTTSDYSTVVDSTGYFLEYDICDRASGSRELAHVDPFEIYPNPSEDRIHIRSLEPILRYSIRDMQGRIIEHGNGLSPDIHIAHLEPGSYFLQCTHRDGTLSVRRFVKA